MGLLDLFSDSNERAAAHTVKKGYEKGYKGAKKDLQSGFKGLKKDYNAALDDITGGQAVADRRLIGAQDSATGAINTGLNQSTGAITTGRDAGLAALGTGLNQSTQAVTDARNAALVGLNPYTRAGERGSSMLQNALGLKGAEGNAAAVNAYQTAPGYEWQMDQGMQALQRLNASRGRLDSGNTMIDAMTYSQGLADQDYGTWLDRLTGQQSLGYNAATQKAGIYTGAGNSLANLYTGYGQNAADINTGASSNLANLYSGAGSSLAGIYTGTGSQLSGNAMQGATQNAAIHTGLGDVKMGYGQNLADLGYATRLGMAGVEGQYLAGKDQSAMNGIGAVTGTINAGVKAGGSPEESLGARLLNMRTAS
jgi:hypothetical protein